MKKLLPALLLAALSFYACDDDNDARTISITFTSNSLVGGGTRWVFISDAEGNSIDYEQLPTEGTVVLEIPEHVSDEKVTLNYFTVGGISWSPPKDLISFAGIAPGNYSISTKRDGVLPGNAEVSLQNADSDVDVTFSGQAYIMGKFDDVFALNIFPDTNNEAKALVSGFDDLTDDARYKFFSIKKNESLNFDFDTFSEFEKSTIDISGDVCHISQYGYVDNIEYLIRGKHYILHAEGPNSLPLYHAPGFGSYLTNIRLYTGEDSYSNIVSGPQVPETFVKLNANVNVTAIDDSGFSLNFTGNAELTQVIFTHEVINRWGQNTVNTRMYHLPAGGSLSFRHPIVPAEILEAVGAESYPVGTLDRIALADYEAFVNYDEYIQYRLIDGNDFFLEVRSSSKWRAKGF